MSEPADTTVPENSDDRIAVLFDIDGTLVDSNYLHVDAWDRAFADAGSTASGRRSCTASTTFRTPPGCG